MASAALKGLTSKLSPYTSVLTKDDENSDVSTGSATQVTLTSRKKRLSWSYIKSFGTDNWMLEIVSAVTSVLSFIAIVAVLGHFDGRDITLMPHGLTLNGIISVLATLSKATLLTAIATAIGQYKWIRFSKWEPNQLQDLQALDDASRGPRGSFMLLVNGRVRSIAMLGAILTIFSVGFDPSIQLLIHTDFRILFANDTHASLTHTTTFKDEGYYSDGLSLPYRQAVITALSDSAPSFDMAPACASKNCTWPVYQNLRLSSECKNITQWIFDQADTSDAPAGYDFSTFCKQQCDSPTAGSDGVLRCTAGTMITTECHYSMPGPFEDITDSYTSIGNDDIGLPIFYGKALPGGNVKDTEAAALLGQEPDELPLVMTASLRLTTENLALSDSRRTEAFLCALSLRFETVNTSVRDGLAHTQVEQSMKLSNVSNVIISDPNDGLGELENSTLHFTSGGGEVGQGTFRNLSIPVTFWSLLNTTLTGYLVGNLTRTGSISHLQLGRTPSPDSEVMQGMFETNNFPAMMDRVAASFTKQMNIYGGESLSGQSGHMETYFRINWRWIVLPLIVLLGGIVFLILAMVETKWRKLEVWKSSSLPLMYSASDCDLKRDNDPVKLTEMESLAEKTMVTLQRTSREGWTFQRAPMEKSRASLV